MATYPKIWSPWKAGTSRNETGGFQNHERWCHGLEFRPGGLNAKPRQFEPKMFQTGGERCPVALFRQYISRRPPNLRTSGPFYLSIKYNIGSSDEITYKVQPMGENRINSTMKNIISKTTLESSEKRFSNHIACKTLVSKMKDANLERSSIAKVSGHRNIQSSDDYDEADEDEQQQLSWTISERNSTTKPMAVASITSGPCTSSAVIPLMMSSQAQNLMNAFTNCTVTFNLNSKTSPVIKPRKRRLHFIESDSDTDWCRQFLELLSCTLNFTLRKLSFWSKAVVQWFELYTEKTVVLIRKAVVQWFK